jgi:hypothetical protein
MRRSVALIALVSVVGACATTTDPEGKLAAFMAKIDGKEIRPVDRNLAACLTKHVAGFQVNSLLNKASADDKDGFEELFKGLFDRNPKLKDCAERAAFRALFGVDG